MRKKLILLILMVPFLAFAQEEEEKKFGIKLSGYVKNDFIFDTRQTVTAREGHFLLWPTAKDMDPDGKDINEGFNFNFLAIQTRLKGAISGPDAFGAKTSGVIEGAFFGHSESDVNGFRLRHAFVKLNWQSTELLLGQYWHPMFVTDCFPGTVSFNTGAPFQPFSRNPQIRLTQNFSSVKLIFAAQSQRDFANRLVGSATQTSKYLRNSGIPDLQFQIHIAPGVDEGAKKFIVGAGIGYKSILPYTETTSGYKTDKSVSGLSLLGFCKIKSSALTFKFEGAYGENVTDFLSIGGFAVKDTVDLTRGIVEYTPIAMMSGWTDIHTNGKKIQVGLFAGYSKNLGSKEEINGPIYGLGTNIAYLYRISPRFILNAGKFRFAAEIEYTAAAYGNINNKAIPENEKEVADFRTLLAAYYFF